ncbi:hypothetical protein O6H91_01G075500 [Diphasiastrum complanatum]|uniref:Uncharacterized protein n=1 Tax=Diphasiastrum complanatum TaxID=34168 RepID=A0ACC2ESD9_DIPCM|nr:hypothetical protein O6H91_01G075500 [Diphasiastrum complanatum]
MSVSLPAPLSILLESLSGLICGRSHYSKLDSGVSSVNGEHVGDSAAKVAIRSRSRLEEMQALPFPTAEMHLKIHLLIRHHFHSHIERWGVILWQVHQQVHVLSTSRVLKALMQVLSAIIERQSHKDMTFNLFQDGLSHSCPLQHCC